jgi:UDP-glucuronate 4-epimerase
VSRCYLVTGCAGFIASKVTEMLLEAGHLVVGVDNLNDAYDPRLKQWRLAQLQPHANFRFHRLDITDRPALEELFEAVADGREAGELEPEPRPLTPGPSPRKRGEGRPVADSPSPRKGGEGSMFADTQVEQRPFSAVVNLAARAGVRPSVENPRVYYQANCDGTLNLLELCRRYGVRKFLLASTSSLYGAHNPVPFREDADTDRPLSPYAASKKAAETLAYTYHYLHGMDVSIPRYFTVYGPAGRPDMSIFRFIRRIAEGEPIVVFGDGSQSRDFTYVDDIARGTIAALEPLGYEVINLGGDQPTRLSAVIEQIAELVGRQPRIEYRPAHPADVPATWAEIGKARRLLGWSPQISVEEGLRRSVAWYQENRSTVLPLELGDREPNGTTPK